MATPVTWDRLIAALRSPSPDTWKQVVACGNRILLRQVDNEAAQLLFLDTVTRHLTTWPTELNRPVPKTWPLQWQRQLGYSVKEIDLYGKFILGICGDARLRLSDGMQAVYLIRRFVGAAKSFTGDRVMQIGQTGEADVVGSLTLELPGYEASSVTRESFWRLAVPLGVEVKLPKGRLEDSQLVWQAAVRKRGWIVVTAVTIESAVTQIVDWRDSLMSLLARGA